ncbi:MAG: DUF4209 domain-containing protein [Gemmatimonadota bacterium]|nr:DUF4209 domain-containing protein [Gemmatimonadota bacterium]
MTNYQEDLILTSEDFVCCGWKEVLAGADRKDYSSIYFAFSDAARQAVNENHQAHGKVLLLLAQACSMMLSPGSFNEPFKPFMVLDGQRSSIPDDLSESDVDFFARIIDEIDDPCPKAHLLKARLADLVWLLQSSRGVKFALAAIDSYRSIPLDTETWLRDGQQCWQRAIDLARRLRGGSGERVTKIEVSIIEVFKSATRQDGSLGFWLADLLKSNGLGRDHSSKIAIKLESLARDFEGEGEFLKAREYFQASADWFKVSGEDETSIAMIVEVAEGWVKEAEAKLSSSQPSHIIVVDYYEKAIQTYRTIPKSMRAPHRVDERIAELRRYLNESGERSLDEMGIIRIPGRDICQIVQDARNLVRGKTLNEALEAFVNLVSNENARELRENTIEQIRNYPLQFLFSGTAMSRDGRVIARRPGMIPHSTFSDNDEADDGEETIRAKMIENYRIHVDRVVRGCILPAQEVLLLEHRLREVDFINLARQSPIVPIGREQLFGKALFAGYDQNFVTALHILVPQIEHMVRYRLKQVGEQTTTLDSNGIENEKGLSALMDLPQAEEIFGEDLSFEIKALFCDPFGPNLRNELAHGLLDDMAFYSLEAIYAWWFGLKLVCNTFWNALDNDAEQSEQGEE